MANLENRLLSEGLVEGNFQLASGNYSHEKFDFDRISENPENKELFEQTAKKLGYLLGVVFIDTEAVITVANGANPLAEPVAKSAANRTKRGVQAFTSHKTPDGVIIPDDLDDLIGLKCTIVDDVYTRGTNSTKLATRLAETGVNVLGAAVVLNRSDNSKPKIELQGEKLPVISLIHHEIADSPSHAQ